MALELRESLRPVFDFVVQVIVGAALFTVILLVALVLAGIVHLLSLVGFSPEWLIKGAHWLEFGIFWFDAFCFALFLGSEAAKLVRGLWREWERS